MLLKVSKAFNFSYGSGGLIAYYYLLVDILISQFFSFGRLGKEPIVVFTRLVTLLTINLLL